MSRRASTHWATCLMALSCIACSATPTKNTQIRGQGTAAKGAASTAAGSGAAPATTGAAGGASTPSGFDTTSGDNPGKLIPLVPQMPTGGMAGGGGAGGSNLTPEGCEIGKFCAPQTADSNCGTLDLKTDLKTVMKPGNIMVIFDRSTSMEADWGGSPKYEAAGNALTAAIAPLKDLLTMGGIFFPSQPAMGGMTDNPCPMGCNVADPIHWIPGPGACCLNVVAAGACDVNTIDKPDEINWGPADAFIMGLPNQWHFNGIAQTPLGLAVQRAAESISSKKFTEPLVVIIMTDGEPNCDTQPQSVIDQVSMWKTANIPTYVIGLPGIQGAEAFLNQVATAGGTDMFISPSDPMALQDKLKMVITSTVRAGFDSCTFKLDPPAQVPEKLHLVIKQNGMEVDIPKDWSATAHWKISADGAQVDLEDQLCDMAKDGTLEGLHFVFGCVDVPPAPPPPPPPMLN